MTDITWPDGVPDKLLRSGAAITPGDGTVRSATDSGLTRQRRVHTVALDQVSGTIRMSREEYEVFETWRHALGGGVFLWSHPIKNHDVTARFVAGQQGQVRADTATAKLLVTVTLEILP